MGKGGRCGLLQHELGGRRTSQLERRRAGQQRQSGSRHAIGAEAAAGACRCSRCRVRQEPRTLWVAAVRSKLAPTVGRAASQPIQTGSISGEYTLRGSVEV